MRKERKTMMDGDTDRSAEALPVACSLTADEQARRGGEIATLFEERQEVRELPDGYALRFAGDDAQAARLLAFIAGERACCPFFTFALVFEPAQGPVWLQLRGPDGTKEVVAGMLAGAGRLPATPL
jgi:hypothetical protein